MEPPEAAPLRSLGANLPTTEREPAGFSLARATQAARRGQAHATRIHRIDWRIREALARQEPFFLRCVEKQTGDMVKLGFTVTEPGTNEPHPVDDVFWAWAKDSFLLTKTRQALIDAHIHAEGYVEIEWDDGRPSDQPRKPGSLPVAVHVIDPVGLRCEPGRRGDEQTLYLVQDTATGGVVVLHPDRYHAFHFHHIGRPVSSVEVAYHSLMAKVKGDQGSGEVAYNAGQPQKHAVVKDPKPNELDEMTEMLNSPDFVRGYATDDRTVIEQLNPVTYNPAPFYAEWKGSAAAAVGIPVAIAEGVQAGAVTGSETNLADYHSDLHLAEVNVLEPFMVRLVAAWTGDDAFDIKWLDPPSLPSQDAALLRDRAASINLLIAAGLTREAAARIAGVEAEPTDWQPDPPGVLPPVRPGQFP